MNFTNNSKHTGVKNAGYKFYQLFETNFYDLDGHNLQNFSR